MSIEVKFFPQYQHLSSDCKSMIVYDVSSSTLMELDTITAAIVEEATLHGMWNDDVSRSVRELLLFRGFSCEEIDESTTLFEKLRDEGAFAEADRAFKYQNMRYHINGFTLNVAQKCQLQCKYCYAESGSYGDDELPSLMDSAVGRKAIDFILALDDPEIGDYFFSFFGGEPLLNWSLIKELVIYAKENAKLIGKTVSFSITTNGILLGEEHVDFLVEHDISVLISIDGDEVLHNRLRPHVDRTVNSYQKTREAIKRLRKVRARLSGRATVTAMCYDPWLIRKYLEEAGITDVNMQLVSSEHGSNTALAPNELRYYVEQLSKMILDDNPSNRFSLRRISNRNACMPYGCNFSVGTLAVDSIGRIYACHRLTGNREFMVGSVYEGLDRDKLQVIFNNANANNMHGCRSCWARNICGGGCVAENVTLSSDDFTPHSYRCYMTLRLIEASIEKHLIDMQSSNGAK
ncbi:MAG: SPASM domain-containing protein [Symbiobacteriaceae bacterium]|nr:SPASM domain-containing protein [Symbiobacteriaceae bacterium]